MSDDRFARQTALPGIGAEGQARIASARVLVAGLGGLGCPSARLLAAAGVGTLVLCDGDRVARHNLPRQTLYADADAGRLKTDAARDALRRLAPGARLDVHPMFLDASNADALVSGCAAALDCTDRWGARYALSDACRRAGVPLVHASLYRWEGQAALLCGPPDAPCYRCLAPDPPPPALAPDCAQAGVSGAVAAAVGAMQAGIALRLIAGLSAPWGRVTHVDGSEWTTRAFHLPQRADCPACRGEEVPAFLTLTPAQARAFAAEGALVLDVRTAAERSAMRLAVDDRHVPLDRLDVGAYAGRDVLVYCARGVRSERAAALLAGRGGRVAALGGGVEAWRAAGLPVVGL